MLARASACLREADVDVYSMTTSQKNHLAGGVPNLQVHNLVVDDDRLELEVNPERLHLEPHRTWTS